MQGRIRLWLAPLLLGLIFLGCRNARTKPVESLASEGPNCDLGAAFREAETGSVTGQVRWHGEIPKAAPFRRLDGQEQGVRFHPNPHLPRVDAHSGGVAAAVLFLRGVDIARARPWPYEPVRVVVADKQFALFHGTKTAKIGVVRRGESIGLVNWDKVPHQVRGRGASFFSQPLVDVDAASRRVLDTTGIVELSSGSGCPWMSAHLFVDDQPYYVASDAHGRFVLDQVPAGTYRLACWMPNWRIVQKERDQETSLVVAVAYGKALEQEQTIEVRAGHAATVDFRIGAQDFPAAAP